jgi:creatinine amidohydrolase
MAQLETDRPLFASTLPWTEVKELASAGAWALLPIGSTEAHGPHLPLNVDVLVAEEVCRRVAVRMARRGEAALIFPAVSYGVTDFAVDFCGTVSISAQALLPFLTDAIAGIARTGFGQVGVINHHLEPAHFRLVRQAAQAAAAQTGAKVVVPDHRRPPIAPRLGDEFTHGGSHAGFYETSLMLACAPELVRDDVRQGLADLPVDLPAAIKAGAKRFSECGGKLGYFGSPASASRDEGNRLFEILAEAAEMALSPGR